MKLTDIFIFTNNNNMQWDLIIKKKDESTVTIAFTLTDIINYFNDINQLHKTQLEQLRQTSLRKHFEVSNQLVSDMEYINKQIIRKKINNNDGNTHKFLTGYNIREYHLRDFKFSGCNAHKLKNPLMILPHKNRIKVSLNTIMTHMVKQDISLGTTYIFHE